MRLRIKSAMTVPCLMPLVHRLCSPFRVLHHLQCLLLQELFFFCFRLKRDAVWTGMMVLIQIGESGEAIGGNLFGFATAVHLRVNRQSATTHRNDFTLERDDVAREDRELEVDAVKHEKNGVFCVNILRHSEIRTL